MSLTLPERPAQYFIDEVLLPSWDPSEAAGFDPQAAPGDEAFLPVATSLDTVGASYPSLVVQFSSETTGGESTYDYVTPNGPGQNRRGTLLVTARAESEREYVGDAANYTARSADDLVVDLIEEVEDVCQENATGSGGRRTLKVPSGETYVIETGESEQYSDTDVDGTLQVDGTLTLTGTVADSEFETLGSQRGPEAPDDTTVSPPVRLANTQVDYSWLRSP